MKPIFRLLLLTCLLAALPALVSQPADAAQPCNLKCLHRYQNCLATCNPGPEGCRDTCAQNRADCLCLLCGVC